MISCLNLGPKLDGPSRTDQVLNWKEKSNYLKIILERSFLIETEEEIFARSHAISGSKR